MIDAVFFKLRNCATGAGTDRFGAELRSALVPMSLFRPDGGGSRQIRLASSYASPDDVERGITRLAHFIEHRASLASR